MKGIQYILLCIWMFAVHQGIGQTEKRANQSFVNHDYKRAIKLYSKVLKRDTLDIEATKRLGLIYYKLGAYEEAESYFLRAYQYSTSDDTLSYYYLKSLFNTGKSQQVYHILDSLGDNYSFSTHFLSPDQFEEKRSKRKGEEYILSDLAVNTLASEFSPAFYGDTRVAFVTDRFESGKTNELTGRGYHKTYILDTSDLRSPSPRIEQFELSADAKYNMGPVCFNDEGTEVYFTRNVKYKGKDKKSLVLKIFYARWEQGEWTRPEMLPFGVEGYSDSHPFLDVNGDLYFTSDRPGGFGGVDIYRLEKNGDSWSHPVNLGDQINTLDDEMTPFISEDNVLYFSSKGHAGIGGLDIFAYDLNAANPVAEALPAPINGLKDDLSFITNKELTLFSSNRKEGVDNIYQLEKKDCYTDERLMISGYVYDENEELIANAQIHLSNEEDRLLLSTYSDSKGFYSLPVDDEESYKLLASSKNYFPDSMRLTKSQLNSYANFYLRLDSAEFNKSNNELAGNDDDNGGSGSGSSSNMIPTMELYFEYDKSVLSGNSMIVLDSFIELISAQPYDSVIVSGHTDSRGSKEYNTLLSGKRAQFVADYIKKRIEYPDRVIYQGYGEEQLKNNCGDGVPCSEHKHLRNRRISIDLK